MNQKQRANQPPKFCHHEIPTCTTDSEALSKEMDNIIVLNDLSEWLADCLDSFRAELLALENTFKNAPIRAEDFDFFGEVPIIFKDVVDIFATAASEPTEEEAEKKNQELTREHIVKVYDSIQKDNILLRETELIWLLDLPDIGVEEDTNDSKSVTAQNMYYKEYVDRRKEDHYFVCNDVATQTLSTVCRNVQIQTNYLSTKDKSSMSTGWILFDAYTKPVDDPVTVKKESTLSFTISSFLHFDAGLFLMERAISRNIFRSELIALKGDSSSTGRVQVMSLHFATSKARHFQVTSLAWETSDPNIFAVGYSQQTHLGRQSAAGAVECWSLKNCCYPERKFQTTTGVMSLSFSRTSHILLAAALDDGQILILDVSCKPCRVVHQNTTCEDRSFSRIWQLTWAWIYGIKGEKTEILVSASEDGWVHQWCMRGNFLECMRLTRVRLSDVVSQTVMMPYAFACSVAFNPAPPNNYLIATHEGHIYKYSLDCSERYLQMFRYHSGIVYRVAWSPFDASVFISCSIDGTVAIWHDGEEHPRLVFATHLHRGVVDVIWSRMSATVFVAITDIAVELWDIAYSLWQPVDIYETEVGVHLTSVATVPRTNNIIVGCTNGQTSCFTLNCNGPDNDESVLMRILDSAPGQIHYLSVSESKLAFERMITSELKF